MKGLLKLETAAFFFQIIIAKQQKGETASSLCSYIIGERIEMSPQQGATTNTTALLARNFLFHQSRSISFRFKRFYAAVNDFPDSIGFNFLAFSLWWNFIRWVYFNAIRFVIIVWLAFVTLIIADPREVDALEN